MTTYALGTQTQPRHDVHIETAHALRALVPVGRALFAAIFVLSSFGHFTQKSIDYAAQHGVPFAAILVPISGVLALVGGLSVLLGFKARIGALLLLLFLVPVTLAMHNFWAVTDPTQHEMQRIMFMKNLTMIGATLMLVYFGAGPISFDEHHCRAKGIESGA